MLWILSLLTVIVQCFFVSCRLYEYHLIEENKSWGEAQAYCREKYTDLAVVSDMKDTERISELVKQAVAWIGLHSNQGAENRSWHWSMPGLPNVELSDIQTYFHKGEPNDHSGRENCVAARIKMLSDEKCSTEHKFICVNETNPSNVRFIFFGEKMAWTQAQQHCRAHHTDLASGLDLFNNKEFLSLVSENAWWIGLFKDTWHWSDGGISSFRHWNRSKDAFEEGKCAFVTDRSGKWSSGDCNSQKSFLCHDRCFPHTGPRVNEYCHIENNMTWSEARDYCRGMGADLASMSDMRDTKRIPESVKPTGAWIGLHRNQGAENRSWRWSRPGLPDLEFSDIQTYFHQGEPNDHGGQENCVEAEIKMLSDETCSTEHKFICFNGENSPNERFIMINETMTWTAAQQHCREHHTDLAGGLDLFNDKNFLSSLNESSWWIGLFRDTWRWSDGSISYFRHWDGPEDVFEEGKCACVTDRSGKWRSGNCDSPKTLPLL